MNLCIDFGIFCDIISVYLNFGGIYYGKTYDYLVFEG